MGVIDDPDDVSDDIDETGGLDISTPITLPLTRRQLKQLKDPWDSFTLEEEYYVLYDALTAMVLEFVKALKAIELGEAAIVLGPLLGITDVEVMRDSGIRAMCLAHWMGKNVDSVPELPKSQLIQLEGSLDPEKLAWGRAVRDRLTDDEVLIQVWALRLDELITTVQTYQTTCAEAMSRFLETPPHMFEGHVEYAKIQAELASHRLEIIEKVKQKWVPLWNQGRTTDSEGTSFSDDFEKALDLYANEHRNEFLFLARRKKASGERVRKHLDADPEHRKRKEEWKNRPKPASLAKALLELAEMGGDCNNPNCIIHGEAVRRRQNQENQQPNQQSVIDESTTRTTGNIMATKSNDLADKKASVLKPNKFTNVTVQFVTDPNARAIRLPDGMTYEEARYWLGMIEQEETRTFSFEFKFVGWSIMDAVWAVYQAAVGLMGFAHIGDEERHSFFGTWKVTPQLVTIPTGPNTTQQIPWGPIEVSGLSAALQPSIGVVEGNYVLQLTAEIKNNERQLADKLMKLAIKQLEEHSIYRGQAIEMNFASMQPGNFASFDPTKAPKFMDLGDPEIDELVLPNNVQRLVDVALWTPIRKTAEARKHKIPLRRTVTLAGPHGVGKTLTALATAKIATKHGWTFLYLRDLDQLEAALYFAKKYAPCVVFAEDVDTIVSGDRDEKMNKVFNVVDGLDRKNHDVMLVFSTNCIEDIHQGMLRPGRTDTVIPFTPPDGEAVERLMRIYGRGIIDVNADLTAVAGRLAGQIPAIIREAVEYSKLAAINDCSDGELIVRTEHLDAAVDQMLVHAELLQEPEQDRPDMEVLGEAIGRIVVNGLAFHDVELTKNTKAEAREGVHDIIEQANLRGNNNHTTLSDERPGT